MKRPLKPPPRALGSVSSGEVLPLKEFGRRMNLANRALADAQRTICFLREELRILRDSEALHQGEAFMESIPAERKSPPPRKFRVKIPIPGYQSGPGKIAPCQILEAEEVP